MQSKMQSVLEAYYAKQFPLLYTSVALSSIGLDLRSAEDQAVLDRMFARDLDALLPYMLRPEVFVEMHFGLFPALATVAPDAIKLELVRIARDVDSCTVFGDGRYLKIANTQIDKGGEEYGNEMLALIGRCIVAINSDIYARFRQGDEFVMIHSTTDELLDRVEAELRHLEQNEVVPGLPVGIDFGYARHGEVATTYLRLLSEGWHPPTGRQGRQVFLDIALKIAKVRSDVQKVYNRAWLLLALYRELARESPEDYRELEGKLTRGDRFIKPSQAWLEVTEEQLPEFIRLETLAFVATDGSEDHFARVCIEVGESIYLDRIVT